MKSDPSQHTARSSARTTLPWVLWVAAAAACVLTAIAYYDGYRINLTPSEPLGLWRIVPLDRAAVVGDLVFICPPRTRETRDARMRGYFRVGLCPGGTAPLIKIVVAVAGQRVDIGASVMVDDHEIPSSRLSPRDGKGRPLTLFAGGIIPPGKVFVHSPFEGSYDSRYFGPLPSSGILGLAQEVWTHAP